jgi:putative oxidoreductase
VSPEFVSVLVILSRILVGGFFLVTGLRNTRNVDAIAALMSMKVPMAREAVMFGIGMQIVGGTSVVLGLWPAVGATILIVFTVIAVALYHDFWKYTGEERIKHVNYVLNACAFTGGLVAILALSA